MAVTAGEALYIVDAGTVSNATMVLAGESLQHLQAILLTHFHSDHIVGLADFNLTSWVLGRDAPLQVMGPPGVERVVAGFNEAFALDRDYRVTHHGADLLDPAVTDTLQAAAQDADLLLQDALSLPIVKALEAGARQGGRDRQAKVLLDIQDYHAAAGELPALAESAGVGMLALYHLVPAPSNYLLERIFERDLPDDAVVTVDGMVFELPRGVADIHVIAP